MIKIFHIKLTFIFLAVLCFLSGCKEEKNPQSIELPQKSAVIKIEPIPLLSFNEGNHSFQVNLSEYIAVTNIDKNELDLNFSKSQNLDVSLNDRFILNVTTINHDWFGIDTLSFLLSSGDTLSAESIIVFDVIPVNDPPELLLPFTLSGYEDTELYPLKLSSLVRDIDNQFKELTFQLNSKNLLIHRSGDYIFLKPKVENWFGTDTVFISVRDISRGTANGKIFVNIEPVNDNPDFAQIPEQSIMEGEEFPQIDLKDYVNDIDNTNSELKYSVPGTYELTVNITNEGILKINTPSENWFGTDTIFVAVTDPYGLRSSCLVVLKVKPKNDPPVISYIPDQTIKQGDQFIPIQLNEYADDIDDNFAELKWNVYGNKNIDVKLDIHNTASFFIKDEDWCGTDTLNFIVSDRQGLSDTVSTIFIVIEKPFLEKQPYKSFVNIGLTGVEDVVSLITAPIRWKKNDWLTFGVVAGGSYLLTHVDENFRTIAKRQSNLIDSPLLEFGEYYGRGTTSYIMAGGFAAYGIVLQDKTALRIGLEIFESYFITNTIQSWLKKGFGRSRPYREEGPFEFSPFDSKDNSRRSFPSGHTTLAFSLSSVLAAHVDDWYWKALIFTPAVLTAAQRYVYDQHWFSDLFLGASIGYFIGTYIVRRHDDLMDSRFAFYLDQYGRIGIAYNLK